jgi:hypothetical protein
VSCDPRCTHWRTVINAWETWAVPAADSVCCARIGWEINYYLNFEIAPLFCVCLYFSRCIVMCQDNFISVLILLKLEILKKLVSTLFRWTFISVNAPTLPLRCLYALSYRSCSCYHIQPLCIKFQDWFNILLGNSGKICSEGVLFFLTQSRNFMDKGSIVPN